MCKEGEWYWVKETKGTGWVAALYDGEKYGWRVALACVVEEGSYLSSSSRETQYPASGPGCLHEIGSQLTAGWYWIKHNDNEAGPDQWDMGKFNGGTFFDFQGCDLPTNFINEVGPRIEPPKEA